MDVLDAINIAGTVQTGRDVARWQRASRDQLVRALTATRVVEEWVDAVRAELLAECRRSTWGGGYRDHEHGLVSVDDVAYALGVSRSKAHRMMAAAVEARLSSTSNVPPPRR